MKELYIVWGMIVCFMLMSANSKGTHILGGLFEGGGGTGSTYNSYGRGWGSWGGGGGYHK